MTSESDANYRLAYHRFMNYSISRCRGDKVGAEDIAHEMFLMALTSERKKGFQVHKRKYSWLYLNAVKKISRNKIDSKFFGCDDEISNTTYNALNDFFEFQCDTFAVSQKEMPKVIFTIDKAKEICFVVNDLREILGAKKERKDGDFIKSVKKGFRLYMYDNRFFVNCNEIAAELGCSKSTIFRRKLAKNIEFTYKGIEAR